MTDRLTEIFEHQHKLAIEFNKIERANGFVFDDSMPVDLESFHGQQRIRDMGWRVVEEINEVILAVRDGKDLSEIHEELADVLHFLVELYLIAGIRLEVPSTAEDPLDYLFLPRRKGMEEYILSYLRETVERLVNGIHYLRNRPWKQTKRSTDWDRFQQAIQMVFYSYVDACRSAGLTASTLYAHYFRKASINQERIETGV